MNIEDAESVKVLRLQPGDSLVLTYPGRLSTEAAYHLRAQFERRFPGVPVVILTDGMTLDVLRDAA